METEGDLTALSALGKMWEWVLMAALLFQVVVFMLLRGWVDR
jgi:hypothetical protein